MREHKTKKIVINKCYGGFGLSPLAVMEWAKRKGRDCFFFANKRTPDGQRIDFEKYIPVSLSQAEGEFMWHAFDIPNPNEILKHKKDWHEMTLRERTASNKNHDKHSLSLRDIERDNPDLVAVVKKLGAKADGKHAKLKIITIPRDTKYSIEEYDGIEWIAENHETWS